MGRAYLVIIVVLGLLGSCLSNVSSRQASSNSNGPNYIDREKASSERDPNLPREAGDESSFSSDGIALKREHDGHFYADAEVNGQSIRFLVDTGASGIALSRADARRAGIGISIGMPEVVGEGASGDVRGEHVTVDRLSLGSAEAENLSAVVLDKGERSLLGQSFLRKFDSVEIRGDTMVLR